MRINFLFSAVLAISAVPIAAQVALPGVGVPNIGGVLDPATDTLDRTTQGARQTVERLAGDRLRWLDQLLRANRDRIERDARGALARRGEILAMDASDAALDAARQAGFAVQAQETVEGLDLAVATLRVPNGITLAEAEKLLSRLMPEASISADNLHFQSGMGATPVLAAATAGTGHAAPVGMIDGAPGKVVPVTEVRSFASGGPHPSNHGSAVASLLLRAGADTVRAADVYGQDKAGGNAMAIARAIGWLVASHSAVISISLIGPRNPVVERAVGLAQRKGAVIVAAVGNDGPAAPPAYPASYPGVVSVTAVDGRHRPLIEAGRALHLDYAAPGADIRGMNMAGKRVALRGTSFATPLVAARAAVAIGNGKDWRRALDAEAQDLGRKGPDARFGRGLICGKCAGR